MLCIGVDRPARCPYGGLVIERPSISKAQNPPSRPQAEKGVQRDEPPPSNAPVRARGGEFERRRAIFERAVNYMPVACSLANVLAPLALPAQGRVQGSALPLAA